MIENLLKNNIKSCNIFRSLTVIKWAIWFSMYRGIAEILGVFKEVEMI